MDIHERIEEALSLVDEAECLGEMQGGHGGADRPAVTACSRELKKALQKQWGFKVRVKTSGSKKPDPFVKISPVNWREDKIPNEFRKKVVKATGGSPRNMDDIDYGNVRSSGVTLSYSELFKIMGPLASTAGPKRTRKKKASPAGEGLYDALKGIVDSKQMTTIPGVGRVDLTTAHMVVGVLDKLNPANRKKLLSMPWPKVHSIAMKMYR